MNSRLQERRKLGGLRWYVPLLLIPIPVLISLGMRVQGADDAPSSADAPCSASEIVHRAVLLLDLRKPVDEAHASLPGRLLDDVTIDLYADTELAVYSVSPFAEAPRTLLGRLCKPYDNGELLVQAAKHQRNTIGDCGDLPAQIPAASRADARQFCEQRNVLRRRIDALVAQSEGSTATNAYLVEALEETTRDFADSSVPTSLYVFSDMMQHAKWYSHVDVQPDAWEFETFVAARGSQGPGIEPLARPSTDLPVKIFYVARAGTTDNPELRRRHQGFWQTYFENADLHFDDQPTMAGYASKTLMDIPTPMELAAYEREQLRYQSELVEKERAELERTRVEFEQERADFAERQEQLAQLQRRLAEEQRELAAKRREVEAQDQLSETRRVGETTDQDA
ncbi:MAG: hypothetical protein F4029_09305 [Gammaproteobacteria bacterium]|nr:hypothetical protein [Gammaproteobacteria bacterium]MYK46413.1 hypothetical protein [Gammaproteobacteria bacterium]